MALGETAQLAVQLNLTGNFDKGIRQAQASLTGVAKTTQSLGQQIKGSVLSGVGLGAGVTGFALLTQGINASIDAVGDAVGAASDMTETQTKLEQVFIDSADSVRRFAADSDRAMGLSNRAALELTATFGNFLQALGQTEEQSRRISQDMVQLSADLASFNNVAGGAEEVSQRLFSGLSGEMEAVRRLGIDLSETAVNLHLVAQGAQRTNGEFTQSQKVLARYELIMQDTRKAQGDFARTSENLANKQRTLDSRFANIQTRIGQGLLPAAGLLVDAFGGFADVLDVLVGGGSGLLDQYIRDQKAAAAATSGTTEAVAEQEGEWALSGTALDSFIDGLNAVSASAPTVDMLRRLKDELRPMAEAMGETEEKVGEFILVMRQLGYSEDQIIAKVREVWQSVTSAESERARNAMATLPVIVDKAAAATEDAARRMANDYAQAALRVDNATDHIVKDLSDLPDDMRKTIRDGRGTVRQAMQDLRFAMEHPFAGDRYERFLERKQRAAQRNLNRALEDGNIDAQIRAQAIVDSIQGELDQLDNQRYNFRVNIGWRAIGGLGGQPGNVGQRASGGLVPPYRTVIVGERGPELLRMGGAMGDVAPMGVGRMLVRNEVMVPAYAVNRATTRLVDTRRQGHNAL